MRRFVDALTKPAQELGAQYGVDPQWIMQEAAQRTAFGKTTIHNNWFNLEGVGDTGCNLHLRVIRTGDVAEGGLKTLTRRMARYSSVRASVRDFLNRLTTGGNLAYTYSAPMVVEEA